MLEVWNNTKKQFRVGARLNIDDFVDEPASSFIRFDPLLRCLSIVHNYMVLLDPLAESGLFDGSYHNRPDVVRFGTKPHNFGVKHSGQYDGRHYGSFTDPLQNFWSVINGKLNSAPLEKVFSQHFVRHGTFKGQTSVGMLNCAEGTYVAVPIQSLFDLEMPLPYYPAIGWEIGVYSDGSIEYHHSDQPIDYLDVGVFFDYLSSHNQVSAFDAVSGYTFSSTITNFSYSSEKALHFEYDVHLIETGPSIEGSRSTHYHIFYDSGEVYQYASSGTDPKVVIMGTHTGSFGASNVITTFPNPGPWAPFTKPLDATYSIIAETPYPIPVVDRVDETEMGKKIFSIGLPIWQSVVDNMFDITALSRDTATVALTRLSSQAFEPSIGKIGAINPLKSLGESLLAKTADAALGDFFRMTWKKILGLGGGAKLVRYRTIISDAIQLISSLEVLDSLRKEPSRLYTATAHYDYPVTLGDRECTIRVRSKVYLKLSPFGLLQILIGRQAIIILNDLLALYYTSIPFGEILLTILQLRKIGDTISTRMFYELPMFFVHSYLIETPFTQTDLDYTGMSNVTGQKAKITYYFRDVSQHLPVLRFSTLVPFYGTGDVGNVIWSLLQQLVGVLSSR